MAKQASEAWTRCKAIIAQTGDLPRIAEHLGCSPGTPVKVLCAAAYTICKERSAGQYSAMPRHYERLRDELLAIAGNRPMAGQPEYVPDIEPQEDTPVMPSNRTNTSDVASAAQALAEALAMANRSQPLDADAVRAIVQREIAAIPPRIIKLEQDGKELGSIEGHVHPTFETLVKAATMRRRDGFHPNIWIYGPPGSGKSTGAAMLAKLLNVPFLFNGPVSMEHQLIGWRDGMGNLHNVAFTEAFVQAGVYCFDDVDKCPTFDPFLTLQAALANGHASFASGIVERHKDSIIIATGNTLGKASADFSSTNIDAAFLDRFDVKIHWDYDAKLERALYGDEAADIVQKARKTAQDKGFTGLFITPRATAAIQALLATGFSVEDAKNMTYRATLSPEQRSMMP